MSNMPDAGIIFQSLHLNPAVALIENLQGSLYSHCGILLDGVVIHAGDPVQCIPLAEFLANGRYGGAYSIYTCGKDNELFAAAKRWLGIPYDHSYNENPHTTYCSKLVVNALESIGLPFPEAVPFDTLAIKNREAELFFKFGRQVDTQPIVTPKMLLPYLRKIVCSYPPAAILNAHDYRGEIHLAAQGSLGSGRSRKTETAS